MVTSTMLHSTTASTVLAIGAALLSAQSSVLPVWGAELSAAGLAYTPTIDKCPSGFSLVRKLSTSASQQTLSAGEQAYIEAREDLLPAAWETYLENVAETGVTLPEYVSGFLKSGCSDTLPKFAIATSGGGYRAAIFGAGVLNTLDARSSNKTGLNGLLQAATYLAGLSGGSWLYVHQFMLLSCFICSSDQSRLPSSSQLPSYPRFNFWPFVALFPSNLQ
jgi:hypothetical protein